MRFIKIVPAGAVALLLMASMAKADAAAVEDAQDTGDVMDLATVSHGHSETLPDVLVHSFSTFEEWTHEEFLGAQIRIWLPDGDGRYDGTLVISRDDAQQTLRGFVYGHPSGRLRSFVEIFRPDNRTVIAEVPTSALARDFESYKWKTFLSYPCDRTGTIPCAPPPPDTHEGRVLHELDQ